MNSTLFYDAWIPGGTVTRLVSDYTPFCSAVG
jgi:hypothetical protein